MEKFKTREEANDVIEMCSYFKSVLRDFSEYLSKYGLDQFTDHIEKMNIISDALAMEAFVFRSRISVEKFNNLCSKLFNDTENGNK